MAPRVGRHAATFNVRTVPNTDVGRTLRKSVKTLGRRGITPGIEVEQIERRAEAFNLQLRGLGAGILEIPEHAGSNQTHNQTDDCQDDQKLDQCEAVSRCAVDTLSGCERSRTKRSSHVASPMMLRGAPRIDTTSVPMTAPTTIVGAAATAPIRRSRPMPNACSQNSAACRAI